MTQIEFKKPSKLEAIAIVVMLFSLFALYQAAHLYLSAGINWTTNLTGSIPLPGALMFWLFFVLFHIATMFVTARGVLTKTTNSTWNGWDFTIGFMMIVGLYMIAIATIYGVFKGQPNIEFLFNAKWSVLLNLGFAIEAVGMLWFAITD